MELMTETLKARFAEVGQQDNADDPLVIAKYFNPTGGQTWLAISYIEDENVIFCYASLFNDHNNELGYTSLTELAEIKLPFGLGIERDIHFTEKPLSQAKKDNGLV